MHIGETQSCRHSDTATHRAVSPASPQEVGNVLKELEDAVSEVQRVDAKAQSALDLKKQNLKDETKKRGELVKSMEEVHGTRLLGRFGLLLSQDG